jgi:hypothetical protein
MDDSRQAQKFFLSLISTFAPDVDFDRVLDDFSHLPSQDLHQVVREATDAVCEMMRNRLKARPRHWGEEEDIMEWTSVRERELVNLAEDAIAKLEEALIKLNKMVDNEEQLEGARVEERKKGAYELVEE